MALSQSPRKLVPLAMEDEHVPRPKPKSVSANITKRVFFCGVVVEGTEGGRELSHGASARMHGVLPTCTLAHKASARCPSAACAQRLMCILCRCEGAYRLAG